MQDVGVRVTETHTKDYNHRMVTMRVDREGFIERYRNYRIRVHGHIIEVNQDDVFDLYKVLEAYFRDEGLFK